MANYCYYECRIYGKSRETVQQFIDALQYRDMKNGYYLCRIFSADPLDGIWKNEEGAYYADVQGTCAWSVQSCMIGSSYGTSRGMKYGEPKFYVWRNDDGLICYQNIAMTAPMLCKKLGCGIEIWSKESGIGFQEHYIINDKGELLIDDSVDWTEGIETDDEGNFIDTNIDNDVGGFDDYGCYEKSVDVLMAS